MAIAVLDTAGHVKAFASEDGASMLRFDIARAKAWGAIGMGASSRVLGDRAKDNPNFFVSLAASSGKGDFCLRQAQCSSRTRLAKLSGRWVRVVAQLMKMRPSASLVSLPRGCNMAEHGWGHSMRFQEQVVIVTGAAQGIGREIACAFAREGAYVAALDIDQSGLESLATATGGDKLMTVVADVTRSEDLTRAVDRTLARWKRVDVLVNNAGGFQALRSTEDIPEDEWDWILRFNLTSAFLLSKAVLPTMRLQRFGPEEIAQMALFLASARSSFSTGGIFMVDGGMHV